jgi:hypothetical protein
MKRRWLLKLGVLACLGFVALVAFLWWTAPTHRIDQRGFEKIRAGMTSDDVVSVIRVPPGDYTTLQLDAMSPGLRRQTLALKNFNNPDISLFKAWLCDSACIVVSFDETDKVRNAYYHSFAEPWPDVLRRWLRIR